MDDQIIEAARMVRECERRAAEHIQGKQRGDVFIEVARELAKGMSMKTIHFNTGRKYTSYGQRITATLHDDGVVTYNDHDRRVDGEFNLCGDQFDRHTVQNAYDTGIGKGTHRSWKDAMMTGGCNANYEG